MWTSPRMYIHVGETSCRGKVRSGKQLMGKKSCWGKRPVTAWMDTRHFSHFLNNTHCNIFRPRYCTGHMKFSGTHWKCIAQEFPMLFQFVPLIFTLAHLFNVFFTVEGQAPSPAPTPVCEYTISGTNCNYCTEIFYAFQCVLLIFTLAYCAHTISCSLLYKSWKYQKWRYMSIFHVFFPQNKHVNKQKHRHDTIGKNRQCTNVLLKAQT